MKTSTTNSIFVLWSTYFKNKSIKPSLLCYPSSSDWNEENKFFIEDEKGKEQMMSFAGNHHPVRVRQITMDEAKNAFC
jgi:hypothetical protein